LRPEGGGLGAYGNKKEKEEKEKEKKKE